MEEVEGFTSHPSRVTLSGSEDGQVISGEADATCVVAGPHVPGM